MYRIALVAFWLQTISLGVGLGGMLFAMPHLSEYASDPQVLAFAMFMMQQGGMLDIMLGALAMIAYGLACVGPRKTLIFLGLSLLISATAELTGTATGWPFGGYAYTSFLGAKILGRVPYPIPFSWFSMGFASYILGLALARRFVPQRPLVTTDLPDVTTTEGARIAFAELHGRALPPRKPDIRIPVVAVFCGAALLTAWDLVLDPAMANASPTLIHFWIWTEHGRYFGMPLRNLAGWFATGLVFIGASRLLWRNDAPSTQMPLGIPFGMYVVNVLWAIGLAASIQLWVPIALATVFGIIPALLALPFVHTALSGRAYNQSKRFVA